MPRVKNYIAKTIFARVVGYGLNDYSAHIFVPSHWDNKDVTLEQYNGKTKGKAQVTQFTKRVKHYNKISCHIPMSNTFIGDIFQVTLDDHKELMDKIFL